MSSNFTPEEIGPDEIERLVRQVEDALRRARPLILENAGKISDHDSKHDGSPVTHIDIAVEDQIMAELAHLSPGIQVYGEESGYDDNVTGTFWLIDPIDGTESYIKNVPVFTSMAALVHNGETVASVIYNPSTGDMYTARKGLGAYKNGQRLDLASMPLPRVAFCKEMFIEALNEILKPSGVACEVAPKGGGHQFALVADGQSAARFTLHGRGYTHDYAPGALLVREAGGAIVPVNDDVYTYKTRSFVACHPKLEPLLRPHVLTFRELEALRAPS